MLILIIKSYEKYNYMTVMINYRKRWVSVNWGGRKCTGGRRGHHQVKIKKAIGTSCYCVGIRKVHQVAILSIYDDKWFVSTNTNGLMYTW